jgi:hypothetical protein
VTKGGARRRGENCTDDPSSSRKLLANAVRVDEDARGLSSRAMMHAALRRSGAETAAIPPAARSRAAGTGEGRVEERGNPMACAPKKAAAKKTVAKKAPAKKAATKKAAKKK